MTPLTVITDPPPTAADAGVAELAARLTPGTFLRVNEPLAPKTTLRVGGPARIYVEPGTEADLAIVRRVCAGHGLPFFLLGRGSNLLIRDGGIPGVVVRLPGGAFSAIRVEGNRIHCGAGARLREVANEARRNGLAGLEFMEGIPGSVGGALRMNAGAMNSQTFTVLESVRFMDPAGEVSERPVAEVPARYRECALFRDHIALAAVFTGRPDLEAAVKARMEAYGRKRWESQPPQASAGCVFKNPSHSAAGRLIDQLGLKGTRVGAAMVSGVHGNFIVNTGGASAREVLELIELVRARVRASSQIELEVEVQIVGVD